MHQKAREEHREGLSTAKYDRVDKLVSSELCQEKVEDVILYRIPNEIQSDKEAEDDRVHLTLRLIAIIISFRLIILLSYIKSLSPS